MKKRNTRKSRSIPHIYGRGAVRSNRASTPDANNKITDAMKVPFLEELVTQLSKIVLRCGDHADDCFKREEDACTCGFTEAYKIAELTKFHGGAQG